MSGRLQSFGVVLTADGLVFIVGGAFAIVKTQQGFARSTRSAPRRA